MKKILEEKMAYRQYAALQQLLAILTGKKGITFSPKKIVAILLTAAELLCCVLFDSPISPRGEALDLSDYTLVFCDEFEGDELDRTSWSHRCLGERRGGFNGEETVQVKDGNLIITGQYLENGSYGAGWYAGAVALNTLHGKGYYEIRCIINDDTDFWSAFWIQSAGASPYEAATSKGGVNAVELDIFESTAADNFFPWNRSAISSTIHCAGVYDDSDKLCSRMLGEFKGKNIYKEYNTYGLEWTDDEYIFYINGVETARSSFGLGVCQNPEQLIVSMELPETLHKTDTSFTTQFIVDYVKIYEKK